MFPAIRSAASSAFAGDSPNGMPGFGSPFSLGMRISSAASRSSSSLWASKYAAICCL
jgi:hypothetical protein